MSAPVHESGESQELQLLHSLRNELSSVKKKITNIQQKIKETEDALYFSCNHKWIIDCSNVGEHTEQVCTVCGLSKRLYI
jgi:hypothetical protein